MNKDAAYSPQDKSIFARRHKPETPEERRDHAVRILARLIGRQIAREQFEREHAIKRRTQKRPSTNTDGKPSPCE